MHNLWYLGTGHVSHASGLQLCAHVTESRSHKLEPAGRGGPAPGLYALGGHASGLAMGLWRPLQLGMSVRDREGERIRIGGASARPRGRPRGRDSSKGPYLVLPLESEQCVGCYL